MKGFENILNQEEKERLDYLHWNEGTLFENEYYQELMLTNGELEQCYLKTLKETCDELGYDYDKYLKGDEEYWYEDYDEFLLLHMQKLNDLLEVGLYEDWIY